ncbi:MAG: beta-propeller fold lactonase family protein [Vicinamibacterales bacterium]
MTRKRNLLIGTTFVASLAVLGTTQVLLEQQTEAQSGNPVMVPRFEVDPTFPKPLPNNWYQGQSIGLWVDAQDHVWMLHRPDALDAIEGAADQKTGECCSQAPPVLEFAQDGTLLRHWGGQDGPNWQWPGSNHGLNVDNKGNVWIGANGGGTDGHILKFTSDGEFLLQVGIKQEEGGLQPDSMSKTRFLTPAKTFFYAPTNEVFVADGYGNRRVAVVDADTGTMKRFWGAYGRPPDDKAAAAQGPYDPAATYQHFRGPVHCADVSNDGYVYVCDRTANRIQVFRVDGTYVTEVYTQRDSRGDGSTWDVAFSRDPQQRFLYVADGRNQKLRIFDRATMTELTSFGKGGHYPGEWYSLHNIATDSKGNLYTVETYQGRRLQRFLYKGLEPVRGRQTGVAWPTSGQ